MDFNKSKLKKDYFIQESTRQLEVLNYGKKFFYRYPEFPKNWIFFCSLLFPYLKDDLMPRYAALIYNGYWWSPERIALQTLIDHTQQSVNGTVRLKLYKGSVSVLARDSANTLFDQNIATFDDDGGAYNQADAGGFIKLNALRMRIAEIAKRKRAK